MTLLLQVTSPIGRPIYTVLVLALAIASTLVPTSAVAEPITYGLDFNEFGHVQNTVCPDAPDGICAAVATMNSFAFLKKHYPEVYGTTKIDRGIQSNLDIAALSFATEGWTSPNGDERLGYYQRTGDALQNLWETKIQWVEDWAPGTTLFHGQAHATGTHPDTWLRGASVAQNYPDFQFLLNEIKNGEDVELVIRSTDPEKPGAHVLTLTGISFDDKNTNGVCDPKECLLAWIDPNFPDGVKFSDRIEFTNGRLEFFEGFSLRQVVFIDAAFAESPVPAPSTIVLIAGGLIVLALVRDRARRKWGFLNKGTDLVRSSFSAGFPTQAPESNSHRPPSSAGRHRAGWSS